MTGQNNELKPISGRMRLMGWLSIIFGVLAIAASTTSGGNRTRPLASVLSPWSSRRFRRSSPRISMPVSAMMRLASPRIFAMSSSEMTLSVGRMVILACQLAAASRVGLRLSA